LRSLPGQVAAQSATDRPRATVEIQEVVIEVGPAPAPAPVPAADPAANLDCDSLLDCVLRAWEERLQRGYRPGQGPSLAFS
jgi:hypothetical protein